MDNICFERALLPTRDNKQSEGEELEVHVGPSYSYRDTVGLE